MRTIVALGVVCGLLFGAFACSSGGGTGNTVEGDGAAVLLPDGTDAGAVTVVRSSTPFNGAGFAAVGPGFVMGPSGMTFLPSATVRLPVDASLLRPDLLTRPPAFVQHVTPRPAS